VTLQSVFTPAQFTAADAGAAQAAQLEASGMQGYHILNRSDQWVNLTDDAGTLLDVIPPWFDTTNTIMLATRHITVTMPASAAAGSLAINGVSAASYQFLIQFYGDSLPVQRTQLAAPTAATGGGAQLIQGAISSTITSGTVSVSGPVSTTQSGSWSVAASQFGSWNVAAVQSGTWNVSATQSGTWNLLAQQSGSWNVAISGTVVVSAATGGIAVVNSPGTTVTVGAGAGTGGVVMQHGSSFLGTISLAAAAISGQQDTFTPPVGTTALYICPNTGSGSSDWATLTRVLVRGNTTNAILFDTFQPSSVPYVVPVFAGDTNISVFSSRAASGTSITMKVYAVNTVAVVAVQNVGSPPLIVQPASGSSQLVIPGTAATTFSNVTSAGPFTDLVLGSFSRFTNLYDASWTCLFEYSAALTGFPLLLGIARFGFVGTTTGKRMIIGTCGVAMDAPYKGTVNSISGAVAASGSKVWPFPLAVAAYFPGDTVLNAIASVYMSNFGSSLQDFQFNTS
jgi:hypothetical protein